MYGSFGFSIWARAAREQVHVCFSRGLVCRRNGCGKIGKRASYKNCATAVQVCGLQGHHVLVVHFTHGGRILASFAFAATSNLEI